MTAYICLALLIGLVIGVVTSVALWSACALSGQIEEKENER